MATRRRAISIRQVQVAVVDHALVAGGFDDFAEIDHALHFDEAEKIALVNRCATRCQSVSGDEPHVRCSRYKGRATRDTLQATSHTSYMGITVDTIPQWCDRCVPGALRRLLYEPTCLLHV